MRKNKPGLFIFESKEDMAAFVLGRWKEIFLESLRSRGVFSVALSGGQTPLDLYCKLAGRIERSWWEKTHVFLVDERLVPFSHRDSNYGMVKKLLLDEAGIPQENRHPVPVGDVSPAVSAERYEEDIRRFFGLAGKEAPEFDLVLLGIGEDGHTASLLPGDPVLKEKSRLAAAVTPCRAGHGRITLTLPVINNSRNIFFLVAGSRKALTLKRVIEERDISLPAALVSPRKGYLLFLVDREAASHLTEKDAGRWSWR